MLFRSLHTKRSPHLIDGDIRRRLFFHALAGSPDTIAAVLRAFETPTTGIVGWSRSYRRGDSYWHRNEHRCRELLTRMGCDGDSAELSFLEGSMFWFRPRALDPLRQLALSAADFEPEIGQIDGTLHHAIERLFCHAAVLANYSIVDTCGRPLAAPSATMGHHWIE